MVLLITTITVGNAMSFWVFLWAQQLCTPQAYLKASLALVDLTVGLIVVPYSIFREAASLGTIFLLSVERSMAMLRPLQRPVVITKCCTAGLVLLSWAVSFLLAIIPLCSGQNITLQYSPCSKMCICSLPTSMPGPISTIMLLFPAFDFYLLMTTFAINFITFTAIHCYFQARRQLGGRTSGGSRLSGADIATAKTIGVLTFAFSAAFNPIAIFVVGSVLGYWWCQFSFYAFWILVSNSCWNVAIYSAVDPWFRRGVRELFCIPKPSRPPGSPPLPAWLASRRSCTQVMHE
ncbi:trace amine-associated receptor 7c-like [Apteryx mantelli]|uniref:Trace amine-associated receptor 7c-like n=1 Tax=Apteryx mantelli TaxID=2696672 RepID=A0ABM4FGH9_9AVES